jgi:hypothetical protein
MSAFTSLDYMNKNETARRPGQRNLRFRYSDQRAGSFARHRATPEVRRTILEKLLVRLHKEPFSNS